MQRYDPFADALRAQTAAATPPTQDELFPNGINMYEYEHLIEPGMSIMDWRDRILRHEQAAAMAGQNTTDGRINPNGNITGIIQPPEGGLPQPNVAPSGGLQITPGVNPFAAAAQRVGLSDYAPAMATQKGQAAALRSGGSDNG